MQNTYSTATYFVITAVFGKQQSWFSSDIKLLPIKVFGKLKL